MAITQVPIELSSTPGIVDNSNSMAITIDSSENVGIGTSSPASLLHLSSYSPVLSFTDTNSFTDANDRFIIRASTSKGNIQWYDDSASTTTELMTFEPNGSIGIGNTSPSSQDGSANNLVISDTAGNGGLTINTPTNAIGGIHFSDGTSGADRYRGIISYGHSDNSMRFHTNTARAMTIDASGNVLVGTTNANPTSSGVNDPGVELSDTGGVRSTVASNPAATFNRKTDDGSVVLFRKDGTTVGDIGIEGGDSLYIQAGAASGSGLHFHPTGATVRPARNGATIDNTIDLGASNRRFKEGFFSSNLNIINPSEDQRGLSITDEQDGGQNLKFLYNASSNVGRVINDNVDQLRFNGANGAMINTPSFSAYATSNQTTVTNSVATKINFGSQIVDTAGGHYATSTSRFTAPHDGTYFFSTSITYAGGNGVDDTMYVDYRVNGTAYTAYRFKDNWRYWSGNGIENSANYSLLIPLSENDYVEVFYNGTSYAITIDGGNSKFSGFAVSLT